MKRRSGFTLIAGFTLIESIIAMVILGFAMVTLISFLYPQIERSAAPHYQTRAANLGQSLMSQILARGFDNNSDFDGGLYRCGEPDSNDADNPCTSVANLGAETNSGETDPSNFNDVDDYIGCWWSDSESECGSATTKNSLSNILGDDVSSQYAHFVVNISVNYVDSDFAVSSSVTTMKRVQISIDTGGYGEFDFTGYRGNY